MVEIAERYVGALVGALLEIEIAKTKPVRDPLCPNLGSPEVTESWLQRIYEGRFDAFALFCEKLCTASSKSEQQLRTEETVISPLIAVTLRYGRHPDLRLRAVRRLAAGKNEPTQDFLLVYSTMLAEVLGGTSFAEALNFTSRFHGGSDTFGDTKPTLSWLAACETARLSDSRPNHDGFVGALQGASGGCAALPFIPSEYARTAELASALFKAAYYA